MIKAKLSLAAVVLSLCTGTAFAGNTYTLKFTSLKSSVHQPFYCVVKNAQPSDVVTGSNYAEMIKGFNSNGQITTNVKKMNTYYFDAYHDPSWKYSFSYGSVKFTVNNANADIQCFNYDSSVGRTLIPGPYGSY